MSFSLGTIPIQKNISTQFQTPFTGLKAIRIGNMSGLSCMIKMNGTGISKILYPGTIDWFPVTAPYTGTIEISPTAILTNTSWWSGSNLTFDAIGVNDSEDGSSYPINLAVPAVTPTASGKPIFSAGFLVTVTVTLVQKLNIFNPANSGVNMIFHSARSFIADTTNGNNTQLQYAQGLDYNFPTAVGIVPHSLSSNIPIVTRPISKANSTAEDAATVRPATVNIEKLFTVSFNSGVVNILEFPDTITLAPGGNLYMTNTCLAASPGLPSGLNFKWTEETFS